LIHFYVTWIAEPVNGAATRNESKRLTVFQREGGIWRMAGGSVAAAQ